MAVYIALLRGINVGGKNKIRMAELKLMFEALGFGHVETYIQSGNVIFESMDEEELLSKKIEGEIKKTFGFAVDIVLRTGEELEQIILNCPFTENEIAEAGLSNTEGESFYVSLMAKTPLPEKLKLLDAYVSENDEYRIIGRDIYLLFRRSIRNSKLAGNMQKLEVVSTVRNWKTINKLCSLVKII